MKPSLFCISIVIGSFGVVLLNMPARAKSCLAFVSYTWELDTKTHVASKIAKSSDPTEICQFPKSGDENVAVEIRKGNELVYKREIYVTLLRHFDIFDPKHPAQLSGGRIQEDAPIVISYLPDGLEGKNTTITFRLLDTGSILAEGPL